MAQRVERGVPVVPIRNLSRLPNNLSAQTEATTRCPFPLIDDETAFAFYIPEEYVGLHKDALAFASQRRDPIPNDLVLFELKDGERRFRCVYEVKSDGYVTIRPLKFPLKSAKIEKETIKFHEIDQMSVVMLVVKT